MTTVMLFCIDEEAKAVSQINYPPHCLATLHTDLGVKFVRKVLSIKHPGSFPAPVFSLVLSNAQPTSEQEFKQDLGENETFETDFMGSSIKDCQNWALENQQAVNFLETDLIAVVDARSAKDETILLTHYTRDSGIDEPEYEDDEFGVLPHEQAIWYDYRIDHGQEMEATLCLTTHSPYETFYPTYFGRKEALTNENGVFDVARAARFMAGEDPDAQEI
jgi:hypothetical protein